jgi:undecaprenyl-diphosphatase
VTRGARRRWAWFEASTLVVLAFVAVATWSFLELADYADDPDEISRYDRGILRAMRSDADPSDPLGPPWFEETVRDVTALGGLGLLTLFTLIVIGYLVATRRRRTAVLLATSIAGGTALAFGLKDLFDRARPDVVPHLMHVSTASFPSGHAMLSAVVYLTLGALLAQVQSSWWLRAYVLAVAVLLAVLVGTSRVYLGVHWPSDVAGGFAVGCAWAGLAWVVERALQRRGDIEPEPTPEGEPQGLRDPAPEPRP